MLRYSAGMIRQLPPGTVVDMNILDRKLKEFMLSLMKDADHLDVHLMTALSGYDKDMKIVLTADNIVIGADLSENTAGITGIEWGGEGGSIVKMLTLPAVRIIPEEPEDLLPPVLSWESGTSVRILELNGKPQQLMLRPVTAADEVYVVFSVKEKDGTEYSLPMFSYPAEE